MRLALGPAALGLYLLAAGAGRAFALDIPRSIDGPVTITESGSYVVTQDIAVALPPAITIAAPNVSIDLNRKTISTAGFDTGSLIVMTPDSQQLLIRNGSIRGGGRYLASVAASLRLTMDHVTCTDGKYGITIAGATNISITDSNIRSERFPLDISGSYPLTFERNVVGSSQYYETGISLAGITSGSFVGNRVSVNTYQGAFFRIDSTGFVRMTNNVFDGDNGMDGVYLASGRYLFADNEINGGHPTGLIVATDGNVIMNNRINGGGGVSTGLSLGGSNNVVSGNVIRDRWTGMSIGGANHKISGNTIIGSWEYGMTVSGSYEMLIANTVHSHFAHFTKGLVLSGDHNLFKVNDLRGNGGPSPPPWMNDLEVHGTTNIDGGGNLVDPAPACDECFDPGFDATIHPTVRDRGRAGDLGR